MRIVRIATDTGPAFGDLVDDRVHLLEGWPRSHQRTGRSVAWEAAELLVPVVPSKIVAVGRNYLAHVREMGYEPPPEPSVFLKPPTALVGPGVAVVLPPEDLSDEVQHEAELGVVIRQHARNLTVDNALAHVAGFTCADDVSARDLQRRDPSNTRAKGFDTFCPVGPWVVTDLDVQAGVGVGCRVNGQVRQAGNTDDLIFGIPHLLAFITRFMTLLPGDLVLTGSPGGTSTLHPGDLVEVEIDGIGVLSHPVRAAAS